MRSLGSRIFVLTSPLNGLTRSKHSYPIGQESILIRPFGLFHESNIILSCTICRKRDFRNWIWENIERRNIAKAYFLLPASNLKFQRVLHHFLDLFSKLSLISLIICGSIVLEAI